METTILETVNSLKWARIQEGEMLKDGLCRKGAIMTNQKIKVMIYYADGGGLVIQHGCGNRSSFSHSYTAPNLPTWGYY